MRSITLKMVLAFLGIALVSIVLIVLLIRWNTNTEFSRFVTDRRGEDLVERLQTYYVNNGSWNGLRRGLENASQITGNPQPRDSMFVLANEDGLVISPGPGYRLGERVSADELARGYAIKVNDKVVGTLVMGHMPMERNPLEEKFIRRINLMLVYSAIGTSIVALLIGIFLSRTLTRPIRELTEATHAVSDGALGAQVSVRSRDEMGELGEAFNKMSADLARSTEARKQMTADIAHELRTPLSLIIGHADAVHDGVLSPSKENFEIVREEALRLDKLVDDLRTLSLADAGELSIHPVTVSAGKMLTDLQATYQHIAAKKDVKINVDAASDIPALWVDPDRMTQVLTNIIDNALHHTPAGGHINLSAKLVADGVQLSIQDSGLGIQVEDVKHIFNRFYRADKSRAREDGGSGLGLAIAKSIVQAHGGQVHAESAPGQGLKIIIKLPLTKA